ncbi:MAG TPA: hypothetical protein PK468_18675 [Candidatus Hydrogenedentes bacterium]|nr:hypothetical protein [Candidatus Hydrogenedentota bacterium]
MVVMCGPAWAEEIATLERLWGPADATAAVANGSLAVCVNGTGRLTACHWPSPGYYNQISYRTVSSEAPLLGVEAHHGAMWGLRADGKTSWVTAPPWTARQFSFRAGEVDTECRWPDSDRVVLQRTLVHTDRDILATHIAVKMDGEPAPLIWYADFSPCTRVIPELPVADWLLDAWNDFAAFADGDRPTIYHFRPRDPGSVAWRQAEEWAATGAMGAHASELGSGVWIGITSDTAVVGLQCGTTDGPDSAFEQAARGVLGGRGAAVGRCNSALMIEPHVEEDAYSASIYVAFGASRAEVDSALEHAVTGGFESMAVGNTVRWWARLAPAALPAMRDPELADLCRRCLIAILGNVDRRSGAIVRAPISQPPLALDWPRHGFWIDLALDLAGYHDLVERHTLFYARLLRSRDAPGKPAGSVPAAAYSNGVEALPHMALEPDAVAWILNACWRHARFLESEERQRYLNQMWDPIRQGADFLVSWVDSRSGGPLPAFRPDALRDDSDVSLLLATFLGVDAALRVASEPDRPAPAAWRDRRRELKALILIQCIGQDGRWIGEGPVPFGLEEIAAAVAPPEPGVEEGWVARLADRRGVEFLQALCELAVAWRGDPGKLARLKPFLRMELPSALARLSLGRDAPRNPVLAPDALAAAFGYITAITYSGAVSW